MAAGGVVDLVKAVVSGTVDNGMALVRPPGHHAMRDESCGYCYINNVAIGAKVALDMGLERILVIDWDVHHGQVGCNFHVHINTDCLRVPRGSSMMTPR